MKKMNINYNLDTTQEKKYIIEINDADGSRKPAKNITNKLQKYGKQFHLVFVVAHSDNIRQTHTHTHTDSKWQIIFIY